MSARITVEHIGLDVPTFLQRDRAASGWAGLFLGAAFDTPKRRLMRLLDDINFELNEGDRLAILGRNGAGKSTLLRVLNRVYQPSAGRLTIEGSCQALLNVSLGFNSQATVRENIFLRGVAMGLGSEYLREQIPAILDFSGLHEKMGHRLRTLSSGQKLRLGFAISTSVQHDIMLMDEWVGTGDAEFVSKAKKRMRSRVGGSKIVVLASHSTGLVRDICNKAIVLERGRLVYAGEIMSGLKYYHELMAELRVQAVPDLPQLEGGQLVYGCLEEIDLRNDGLHLRGWATGTEGMVAQGLVLQANGQRYPLEDMVRLRRSDVARHFGLSDDACGFQARITLPGVRALSELDDLQLLGGDDAETAFTPLRVAPAVVATLKSGAG